MLKRVLASTAFLVLVSANAAFAQYRFEASGFGGWSFSDGVSGQTVISGTGQAFNRLDPKDSAVWGASFGYLFTERTEAGFMWTRQSSKLLAGGTSDREIGDMSVSNYHGYLAYNFADSATAVRPFIYGGLGATNFGSVDFTTTQRSGTIGGNTQFSTTWGAGVKLFPSSHFGARITTSWTPVYIKSDAAGYWCDPFWGCYLVGDPQYSNSFHITGGVNVRF